MDNYIPSGKSGRRFSRSSFSRRHLLDDDALFNPARFEKTRNASSSRKKMKTCLSLSLSVCLSLSRARVVAKKSKRHATKKRRLRVVVSQPLKKKQNLIKFALCRLKRREKKKKRTRANAFCLFYAQFYA